MKLLDGRTVTELKKFSLTAAEIDALAADGVVASVAVPPNTFVTDVFFIAPDMGTGGIVDIGFSAYTDTDGNAVSADDEGIQADVAVNAAATNAVYTTGLLVGAGGATISAVISTASTSSTDSDVRIGYRGVGVPENS